LADLIALQFLPAPGGGIDFGQIDEPTGQTIDRNHGPIRLQHGYGGEKGFGNRHVETHSQRVRQLNGLGYRTFSAFVFEIAQNYEIIQVGEADRLVLVYPKAGYDLRIVVAESDHEGEFFWTVITGRVG